MRMVHYFLQRKPLFASALVCMVAMLAQGIAPVARADVLAADNFDSATAGSVLSGRTPDTETGGFKWVTKSDKLIKVNAAGQAFTTGSSGSQNAFLQFVPGHYDTYTLEATLNMQDIDQMVLGITNATSSTYTKLEYGILLNTQNTPRIELDGPRNMSGGGNGATYTLASTSTSNAGFDPDQNFDLKIIYRTAANTITVKVNDNDVFTDVPLTDHNDLSYTPTLKYGSFLFQNPHKPDDNTYARAHVDNFKITAVPEPGSLALLGLGGLVILTRQRREAHGSASH